MAVVMKSAVTLTPVPSGSRNAGDLDRRVGSVLKERLDAHGITQRSVATATGIDSGQLSRYLRGVKPWTLTELDAVCAYLGTNLTDVIAAAEQG